MTDKEKISYLEKQNSFLSAEVRSQSVEISSLREKVTYLLELLEKQGVKKNSRNSSLPPSKDISVPKNQSLRTLSERKSGGQQGHKGSTLEMVAVADKIIDLKSDFCSACGQSLTDTTYVLQAKRQVVEIPPIVPIYEEYRQYACTCPRCSHLQKADFPANVTAPIQYGSSVIAQVSYLSVYQCLPFRRLKNLFSQVFNLPISEGSIGNLIEKASQKCEVVYAEIKNQISQCDVVGSDETSVKVNGKKWWIWVWQSVLLTFIVVTQSRGSKTVEAIWEKGLENSVLISDRWAAQLKTAVKGHQICLAHLLRDLNYLIEVEKQSFSLDFKDLLRDIFSLKKELIQREKALETTEEQAIQLEHRLNELLTISIDKEKCPQTQTFQTSMLKYRNYILPCLYNLEIPPDNNASERAIRNVKVKQKVSGQFKTGQQYFCIIRSVIDTLIKRKVEVLPALQKIMAI